MFPGIVPPPSQVLGALTGAGQAGDARRRFSSLQQHRHAGEEGLCLAGAWSAQDQYGTRWGLGGSLLKRVQGCDGWATDLHVTDLRALDFGWASTAYPSPTGSADAGSGPLAPCETGPLFYNIWDIGRRVLSSAVKEVEEAQNYPLDQRENAA